MTGVAVRQVRTGDGTYCARAWRDAGHYYAALVPEAIHVPDDDGLAEWFEQAIAEHRAIAPGDGDGHGDGGDRLWLVAEAGGGVTGMIMAEVERPRRDARFQLQRDLSRVRLVVTALVVAAGSRRQGTGTALLTAAEDWGRARGATVAVTDTNLRSPLSVPFYENRMGYERQAVVLRRPL